MEKATQKPISKIEGDPEKGVSSPNQKWHSIASEFFNAPGTMSPFYRRLCAAIQTADMDNTARLRKGFPELVKYVKEGV